jgi:hypothetical protein
MAWQERTDRDLTVAGRHSKRFYSFATRWMVNEVNLHKALTEPKRDVKRIARTFVNARIGKAGMALTKKELETAPAGRGQIHVENLPNP